MRRLASQPPGLRSTLPCRLSLRLEDSAENQLLLGDLTMSASLAQDRCLSASLYTLAEHLVPVVKAVPLTGAAIDQGHRLLDRQSASYALALDLTALLFDGSHRLLRRRQ